MSKKIVITGANGFIGSYLTEHLSKENEIYALVHHLYKAPPQNITYRAFDMNSFGSDVIPNDTDIIIHTAYITSDKLNSEEDINLKATQRLYEIGKRKGVKLFIFLSSFSAATDSKSKYGISKYNTCLALNKQNSLILEPGLVIGNGGLFLKIKDIIKQSNIIPLIANGNQSLQYIFIDDLYKIIQKSIENNINGNYRVAAKKTILMKDFYRYVAQKLNKKIKFIPLPYFLADVLFSISSKLNIDIGVDKDNYLGLKQMKEKEICNTKNEFGITLMELIST